MLLLAVIKVSPVIDVMKSFSLINNVYKSIFIKACLIALIAMPFLVLIHATYRLVYPGAGFAICFVVRNLWGFRLTKINI